MKNYFVTITSIFAGLLLATSALAQGSLVGAWQVEEVEVTGGENAGTFTDPATNIIIFSEGHFARVANFGERPEVEQGGLGSATAYLVRDILFSFRANAGTYETSGSTLTLHFMVARNPGAVGNNPEIEYRVNGDTMVMTGTNPQGVETRTTYRRLD